ncbi:MAG: DUF3995 domain-containing protein [Pseudomonadota bacterium]
MATLALALFFALLAIAVAHALWGLRIWWPWSDERSLARTVVGAPNIEKMPPSYQCMAVAAVMFLLAALTLLLGGISRTLWLADWALTSVGTAASAIFILRGIVGYLPFWAKITPEQPFRRYDQRMYSPLSITLGVGMYLLSQSFVAAGTG